MKLANVKTKAVKSLYKAKMLGIKHSPEILVIACIGTAVGAVATAIVATRKVDDVISEHNDDMQKCSDALSGEVELVEGEEYTEDDYKKDVTITYVRTGLKFVKLYLPTAVLTGLSIAAVLGSHKILTKRNTGLAAALAASNKAFKEYRKRVVEELGEDMDTHFRLGTKAAQIQQTIVDEDGNEKVVTEDVTIAADINELLDTTRYFDRFSTPEAHNSPDYDVFYLNSQENIFTQKLVAFGHVYLNDVYHQLGYDTVALGQQVGWIYNPEDPNCANCVSFQRKKVKRFVNGQWIDSYILDFNHDGDILGRVWDIDAKKTSTEKALQKKLEV